MSLWGFPWQSLKREALCVACSQSSHAPFLILVCHQIKSILHLILEQICVALECLPTLVFSIPFILPPSHTSELWACFLISLLSETRLGFRDVDLDVVWALCGRVLFDWLRSFGCHQSLAGLLPLLICRLAAFLPVQHCLALSRPLWHRWSLLLTLLGIKS